MPLIAHSFAVSASMPLTIVVGGQFGGEGKGLVCAHLVRQFAIDVLVKVGGPNSAHSFGVDGNIHRVRMMPAGSNLGVGKVVFPAGCLIHVDTLFSEIESLNFLGRIFIDPNAGIVDSHHINDQKADLFYSEAGSTLTGTGYATASRARRRLGLARNERRLRDFLADTAAMIHDDLVARRHVLAEGAQAYGLSNYHGQYPYVSSRDTTVGSFLGQIGVGPGFLTSTVLVLKCFPTRNQGGEGDLAHELTHDEVTQWKDSVWEVGGGSFGEGGEPRRVGFFDVTVVKRACIANTPSFLAVTGFDRLQSLMHEPRVRRHYGSIESFKMAVSDETGLPIVFEGWGPFVEDVSTNGLPAF